MHLFETIKASTVPYSSLLPAHFNWIYVRKEAFCFIYCLCSIFRTIVAYLQAVSHSSIRNGWVSPFNWSKSFNVPFAAKCCFKQVCLCCNGLLSNVYWAISLMCECPQRVLPGTRGMQMFWLHSRGSIQRSSLQRSNSNSSKKLSAVNKAPYEPEWTGISTVKPVLVIQGIDEAAGGIFKVSSKSPD